MKGTRATMAGVLEHFPDAAPSRVLFDQNANVKHELGLVSDGESASHRYDSIVTLSGHHYFSICDSSCTLRVLLWCDNKIYLSSYDVVTAT